MPLVPFLPLRRDGCASIRPAWLGIRSEAVIDLDTVARAIALLLDVPVVLISAIDADEHVFVAAHGISIAAADDVSPLCLEVVALNRPVLVQDARRHIAAAAHHECGAALVSYMGVPIAGRDTTCVGAISVFREEDRCWQGRDLVAVRGFVELLVELLAERRDLAAMQQQEARWR